MPWHSLSIPSLVGNYIPLVDEIDAGEVAVLAGDCIYQEKLLLI
ncbi:MAG: hypothetical protein OEW04_09520 [Nitrospirota bacterium]|nr:hypothetical protein [Nitrospirota bacterium]